jgi:site-specific DNA-methyltransferase (adenine-specific)
MNPVIIGDCQLYLGDCREILPTLPKVDAVITDPPYGINKDGKKRSTGGHGGRKEYEFLGWDGERPDDQIIHAIVDAGDTVILWGGNYFSDLLPPTMRWLVWDKGQRIDQSDGELAWTNMQQALRICTMNRVELMLDGAQHPTQKPIRLMEWCIEQAGNPETILDPFMGSGTTGVAAVNLGKSFIGIEREPKYFEIACKRIEQAYAQPDFFVTKAAPKLQQESFL